MCAGHVVADRSAELQLGSAVYEVLRLTAVSGNHAAAKVAEAAIAAALECARINELRGAGGG